MAAAFAFASAQRICLARALAVASFDLAECGASLLACLDAVAAGFEMFALYEARTVLAARSLSFEASCLFVPSVGGLAPHRLFLCCSAAVEPLCLGFRFAIAASEGSFHQLAFSGEALVRPPASFAASEMDRAHLPVSSPSSEALFHESASFLPFDRTASARSYEARAHQTLSSSLARSSCLWCSSWCAERLHEVSLLSVSWEKLKQRRSAA